MLTNEKYQKFINIICAGKKDQRPGQYIMNKLFEYDENTYSEITGTDHDCFYVDTKIPKTMLYLIDKWGKEKESSFSA